MQKVLITGATGFVGTHLVSYLDSTYHCWQLHALVRENQVILENFERQQLVVSSSSINDLSKIKGNIYIHLAGKAHDLKKTSDEQEYFNVNYELTRKLFDHFASDPNAEKFIFISSVKAVSDSPEGVLDESSSPKPITAYGRSKLKAEEYILENCPTGKHIYILRPCMIHGPGNKGNLNMLHSVISRGLPWPLGACNNSRSFLSVQNLCFIIEKILLDQLAPDVYHVADTSPLSTNRLVELIAESTGRTAKIWNIPVGLIRFGAKLGNVLPLPLNEERLQKLTENYVVSNRKLTKALGCGLPIEAEDGMRRTLASFTQS